MNRIEKAKEFLATTVRDLDYLWTSRSSKENFFASLENLNNSVFVEMRRFGVFEMEEIEKTSELFARVSRSKSKGGNSVYEPTGLLVNDLRTHLFQLQTSLRDRGYSVWTKIGDWLIENWMWIVGTFIIGILALIIAMLK